MARGNRYVGSTGGLGNFEPPKPDVSTDESRAKHTEQKARKLRRRRFTKKKHGR